jgi:hypothetical protein
MEPSHTLTYNYLVSSYQQKGMPDEAFLTSPSLTIFHSVMGGKRRTFMEAVQPH